MTDEIDRISKNEEDILKRALEAQRAKASQIPVGNPGDCDLCGEWSGRLVSGACAPCRDRHRLP